MMLSEHKGALALAGCLFTRPGLPGHQKEKGGRDLPLSPFSGVIQFGTASTTMLLPGPPELPESTAPPGAGAAVVGAAAVVEGTGDACPPAEEGPPDEEPPGVLPEPLPLPDPPGTAAAVVCVTGEPGVSVPPPELLPELLPDPLPPGVLPEPAWPGPSYTYPSVVSPGAEGLSAVPDPGLPEPLPG